MPDYNVQVIVPGSQATTVELPGIAGPPGPQGPVGPAGIPNTGILDLRYVTLSGNQTISGSKRFVQDDIIYTSNTFTDPYTNLIVDYSYINNLILKPVPEYRPVVSPNPNYLYTGIDGGTESQMYFDTGASRWKFYYGGLNPIHLVVESPIVKVGDPITFAARLPMNGWTNSAGNQDTDFKLHYTTIHKNSHQIGGKDYLDPDTINAVAKTGNQNISGLKNFITRPTVNGTGVLLIGEVPQLPNTLVYTTGNQTISGVKNFISRPTVNGTGVLLSGEAAGLPNTLVYTTGDQTISGIKNFINRPTVNGTGVLLSGEATVLPNTIVYTTGNQTISGNKTFANYLVFGNENGIGGSISGSQIPDSDSNLYINGGNAPSYIHLNTSSAGMRLGEDGIYVNPDGEALTIDNTDVIYINGVGSEISAPNTTAYFKDVNANNIYAQTGDFNGLDLNNVDNLLISGIDIYVENGNVSLTNTPTVRGNPVLTGVDLTQYATISNLNLTGANLNNKINTLSGVSVLTYGNQGIYGVKTFYDDVFMNNFTAYGTGTIVNTVTSDVDSNYLILNITGGAIAGGIFFVTGTQGSGLGPIMGYDLSNNKFKIGTGSRNGGITTLDNIATENFVNTNAVLISGNQIINGNKSFYGDVLLSGSSNRIGRYHHIHTDSDYVYIRDQINNIILSSEEYTLNDSSQAQSLVWDVRSLNDSFGVSALNWNSRSLDNQLGTPLLYWTGDNIGIGTNTPTQKLQVDGNIRLNDNGGIYIYDQPNDSDNRIVWQDSELLFQDDFDYSNKQAGFLFDSGPLGENVLFSNIGGPQATFLNMPSGRNGYIAINSDLVATGSILNNKINALSGYISGISAGGSLPSSIVYITGNQTISGVKTFAGGANQILNTTYSNLTGLKATNNLLSGQLYRISDFILKWNNQSINDQTVKTAASGEPLIVAALSNNKIHHIAQSQIYPQDTIYYNIDASSSYSWGTINNNQAIPDFKGWIYRRADNLLNIDIPYDWRNITVNCCKPDISSVPNYSGNYQYNRLDVVRATGAGVLGPTGKLYYSIVTGNSGHNFSEDNFWSPLSPHTESGVYFATDESYGFQALWDDDGIEDFRVNLPAITGSRIQQPIFTNTLSSQGTFYLNNVHDIKIEGGYSNVILGIGFYSNTIGNNFQNNIIGAYFYQNTIGNNFQNNIIGATVYTFIGNIIGDDFQYNNIARDFRNNTIENYMRYNSIRECWNSSIGYNFFDNITQAMYASSIGTSFNVNIIQNTFQYNTIGNNFINNIIGYNFYFNTIGNSFNLNTIGNNSTSNTIGNGFSENTVGDLFYNNTIGNSFNTNTIGSNFNNNTISNSFNTNTVGNGFNANTSEDNFGSIDFTSATHVYNYYNTTLFQNSANSMRLRYFNSSDQLVVTDPTA